MSEPFVKTEVTPHGIEIRYTVGEKVRKYELRCNEDWCNGDEGCRCAFTPEVDRSDCLQLWVEHPSVTTVTDVLGKQLQWWGQGVGVDMALELHRRRILREVDVQGQKVLALPGPVGEGASGLVVAGQEQIVAIGSSLQLTVNHAKEKGGDRGQSVHDAFEFWGQDGVLPDPEMFAPEERGYIEALVAFLTDLAPGEPEVVASEVMVGSVQHGYAGRFDVKIRTHKPCRLVVHRTPVRGAQYEDFPAGLHLDDLKTSKGVYDSHMIQLEAYELASVEDGYEPTDWRAVIHVNADGTYEYVRSVADAQMFLAVLQLWRELQRLKANRSRRKPKDA